MAFRKTILAVLKKGVPVSCSSGAFRRAQANELPAYVHLSGAQGVRLLLPVIAFIILNLIYHNKKNIARGKLKLICRAQAFCNGGGGEAGYIF